MKLIAGLGNPEKQYKNTRHNLGYMAIDYIKNKIFLKSSAGGQIKINKKLKAEITKIKVNNKQIILAKPLVFMNSSGIAVKKLLTSYKIPINNLIVIHDDVDLFLGKIKVQKAKGSAGHLGVESIIKELKSKDFTRIRLGIGRDTKKEIEKFVLSPFKQKQKEIIKEMLDKACEKVLTLL